MSDDIQHEPLHEHVYRDWCSGQRTRVGLLMTVHRDALIAPYIMGREGEPLDVAVVLNADDGLPDGADALPFAAMNRWRGGDHNLGAYRCFRGHQRLMSHAGTEPMLALEDDAVPNRDDWLDVARSARQLLDEYEVVSLHVRRNCWDRVFAHGGREYGTVAVQQHEGHRVRCGAGSLAYWIRPDAAVRFGAMQWDGMPMDLLLLNKFNACAIVRSPFDHDRSQGSLVEDPK